MNIARQLDRKWFKDFGAGLDVEQALVIFPHAGGSASYYQPLVRALASEIAAYAVQYPGRLERRREPGIVDLRETATQVVDLLVTAAPRSLSLFGHSMGALIAFEVAMRLQEIGMPVRRLFVSGRRSPDLGESEAERALVDDRAVLAHVRSLDPAAAVALDDPELRELALPVLRADYAATLGYRYRPGSILDCPVHALTGDRDPKVTPVQAEAWSAVTTADATLHIYVDGDHFFLKQRNNEIAQLIKDTVCR